tara:strand:+ start:512 stop:1312 length:801 start_codon:yes stop_codon:yes gene_type:complete
MDSISIFTTMTNPDERNDPWRESISCYESFADEVVVVGDDWPKEFDWGIFNKIYQNGFDKCNTDWVMRMDLDYFINENDFERLKSYMQKYKDSPAIVMPQYQFFTYDRYQVKTKLCLLLNKKKFPDIKLNGGTDRMLATLNGNLLTYKNVPQVSVPIWQYDSMFRTKDIISVDRARFARAWERTFGNYGDRGGDDPELAFNAWFDMIIKRYSKHLFRSSLDKHPTFIKEKLKELNKEQFGYSAFGLKDTIKFNYLELPREIKKKYF